PPSLLQYAAVGPRAAVRNRKPPTPTREVSLMSTPRSPAPPHPTREQLDELEALMQRMLALPVNYVDDLGSNGHASAASRPAASALAECSPLFEVGDASGEARVTDPGATD